MKKDKEPFVQRFMRMTGKLTAVFGSADRDYGDSDGTMRRREDVDARIPELTEKKPESKPESNPEDKPDQP